MAISTGMFCEKVREDPAAELYGGQDFRKHDKRGFRSAAEREEAKKFAMFDANAYGEGNVLKAKNAMATVGGEAGGDAFGAMGGSFLGSMFFCEEQSVHCLSKRTRLWFVLQQMSDVVQDSCRVSCCESPDYHRPKCVAPGLPADRGLPSRFWPSARSPRQ